jgi:hypothetical protein
MADQESHCIIELSNGDRIEASDTCEDVENRLRRGGESLKSVTDSDGKTQWVNPAHVVRLHERGSRAPVV